MYKILHRWSSCLRYTIEIFSTNIFMLLSVANDWTYSVTTENVERSTTKKAQYQAVEWEWFWVAGKKRCDIMKIYESMILYTQQKHLRITSQCTAVWVWIYAGFTWEINFGAYPDFLLAMDVPCGLMKTKHLFIIFFLLKIFFLHFMKCNAYIVLGGELETKGKTQYVVDIFIQQWILTPLSENAVNFVNDVL
jgi:hypothetical protein